MEPTPAAGTPEALASEVGLSIAAIADLDELLSVITQRVTEALDVWECDVYEYRPDTDELVACALWARELSEADRDWLGSVYRLAEKPSYRWLLEERGIREFYLDDAALPAEDRAVMERWGERSVLSVPLVFQDEVVGALTLIEKRAPRRFSREDLHLLELLTAPAAVAVHNAGMFRREAWHNQRLQALISASRAMTSTVALDDLLATIATVAGRTLDSAECAINIYEPERDAIRIAAYYQRVRVEDPAGWIGREYLLSEYPADRETLFGGVVVEEHVGDEALDEANRREMAAAGEVTHLGVPMTYEGRPMGLLVFIELDRDRHFSAEERQIAMVLAEQASAAIHNAELLQQTEEQRRQLELLLDSTRAITSTMDLESVLDTVARTTAEALGAEQCQIQEYDSGANTVTPIAFWQRHADKPEPGSMHQVFSLDDEPAERAFLESKHVIEQNYSDPGLADSTRAIMDKYGDRSYLNVPLIMNDQSFGVLVLVETAYDRHWTEDEIALAQALADQAAVAIEHARLYSRVQAQALTDGLTGLYNHRYFYERLEQEVARARRYGTPVSLLMIDIDDFKAFNDRHGHPAGDAVLRRIARLLEQELRRNLDIAARYGGEEFAVILPNTPMTPFGDTQMQIDLTGRAADDEEPPEPGHRDGAEAVAERIRGRVAGTPFKAEGVPLARLTVSIGVAVFPQRTSSVEDLVANADAALYKAKRAGKDRVESYG